MKNIIIFFISVLYSVMSFSQEIVNVVDPNHLKDGGFGYLIKSDKTSSVWWAEGSYKVMRNAPLPTTVDGEIKIWSAKNEYESFIIVVNPTKRLENFRISVNELKDSAGNSINDEDITIRKVEYVKISRPTDDYGFTGWWPDPLPVYDKPETIIPAENQPFWITIKVPSDANAGDYYGEVVMTSQDWLVTVPIRLHVWDFALPHKPSMRSGLGFSLGAVKEYDNLETPEDEQRAFKYYMKSFRDYKISPYRPFELTPIKEEVKGVDWDGGYFDSEVKYSGNYSYKIVDNSATSNVEGTTRELIPENNRDPNQLNWVSRSLKENQPYVVGVECYNAEKKLITFENRFDLYQGNLDWKYEKMDLGKFDHEVKYVKIRLFPSLRTNSGENTGTVWFDDLSLMNLRSNQNEFPAGDFEVLLDEIDIILDYTDFNRAGKLYFDEYGFTGHRLSLKGLGGGTFFSRRYGVFEGFEQGTEEYNRLMSRYLSQMQDNLEENGWLGKEYIYWFDEPNEPDYPFVRETNELIKKYAPKLTTFITEHIADHDISDVTDISATIWHKLNHDKIKQMNEQGLEHWSYLCTWPKSPWISLFIDHDAINLRMWLWGSYQYQLKGILIWQTTMWNSYTASPEGYLQNVWEEAMSFERGYGNPFGKQKIWGNGDGRFFYPFNRDPNNDSNTYTGMPVPSLRLEILRDGIEDYEYLVMLENLVNKTEIENLTIAEEARKLLTIPERIFKDEKTYSKNPQDLLQYRKKIAEHIVRLKKHISD